MAMHLNGIENEQTIMETEDLHGVPVMQTEEESVKSLIVFWIGSVLMSLVGLFGKVLDGLVEIFKLLNEKMIGWLGRQSGKEVQDEKIRKLEEKVEKLMEMEDKYVKLEEKIEKLGELEDKFVKLDEKVGELQDKFVMFEEKVEKLVGLEDKFRKLIEGNKEEKVVVKENRKGSKNFGSEIKRLDSVQKKLEERLGEREAVAKSSEDRLFLIEMLFKSHYLESRVRGANSPRGSPQLPGNMSRRGLSCNEVEKRNEHIRIKKCVTCHAKNGQGCLVIGELVKYYEGIPITWADIDALLTHESSK